VLFDQIESKQIPLLARKLKTNFQEQIEQLVLNYLLMQVAVVRFGFRVQNVLPAPDVVTWHVL